MAGTLTLDTLKASSGVLATQNGMTGIVKAWVNFNGTNGTVINGFNVSSVTRSATGVYLVNITTAMVNANYAILVTSGYAGGTHYPFCWNNTTQSATTTTSFEIQIADSATNQVDATNVYAAALGN